MRPKPFVAWILVAVAAVIAGATAYFVGGFASGYGPTTGQWTDGAAFALQNGAYGVVLAIGTAIVAIVLGRGVWVRVAAAVVIAGSLLGLAAAGGSAAEARWATAAKAPACDDMGVEVAPEIQSAFDELQHPGWIDTLAASTTGCAAVVRNLSVAEVSDAYRDQLIDAGWVIEEDDDTHLIATRGDYTFIISDCGEAWIAIEETGTEWTYC